MSAKKATYPDIGANLYDGAFDNHFCCVGVDRCRFAMCSEMPPTGDEECFFVQYGSCTRPCAQLEAIQQLLYRVNEWMRKKTKELEEA